MFVVFADQACTANIYTHEFNIACMLQKGCYSAKIKSVRSIRESVYARNILGHYTVNSAWDRG